MKPELIVITVNAVLILLAYFVFYPRAVGSDGNKMAFYDAFITVLSLIIAGVLFWGSGQRFDMLILRVNWFWFALITYFLMELPLVWWYCKKYNVWSTWNS
ncbi:MAG TPA: hypothetical protein VF268_07965 [Gammaproteobacteria bacterium]